MVNLSALRIGNVRCELVQRDAADNRQRAHDPGGLGWLCRLLLGWHVFSHQVGYRMTSLTLATSVLVVPKTRNSLPPPMLFSIPLLLWAGLQLAPLM